MGKFNIAGGFTRTIKQICIDYLEYLIKINVIDSSKKEYYLNDGRAEVEALLIEKVYETEKYNGVNISTLNAFWTFCNFIIRTDAATGQRVWNRFVSEAFLIVERNRNVSLMASRGLGKSYKMYNLYPAFKNFLYRGTKFLLVSNIPQQCVSNLRILKATIDSNELLYTKKEVSKGKDLKWTEREIEYNGGYILTLSAGTSPKGQHVHYCICDDILTDTSSYSDIEIENYVLGQLLPCVQRLKGRLVVCGTPLHPKDLYHSLMNTKEDFGGKLIEHGAMSAKGFYSRTFPIITNEAIKEVYLPDVFSWEYLQQIRLNQGEIKFQREYLLRCTDDAVSIFPESLIGKCVDPEEDYWYKDNAENGGMFITGVDVATSGAASADNSAFITIQLIETNKGVKKIIRNVVVEKGMDIAGERDKETGEYISFGQCEVIEDTSKKFNYSHVLVEKNNVGVAFTQELGKRNVDVEEFITTKSKKEGMIRYLVSEMRNGNLIIPGNERIPEIDQLKKELVNFGVKRTKQGKERMEALAGHDDMVMALAIANEGARTLSSLPFAVCQD